MGDDSIITRDVDKFKMLCRVMDGASGQSALKAVQTSPELLHEPLVKFLKPTPAQTLVVFETCDLAGRLHAGARP